MKPDRQLWFAVYLSIKAATPIILTRIQMDKESLCTVIMNAFKFCKVSSSFKMGIYCDWPPFRMSPKWSCQELQFLTFSHSRLVLIPTQITFFFCSLVLFLFCFFMAHQCLTLITWQFPKSKMNSNAFQCSMDEAITDIGFLQQIHLLDNWAHSWRLMKAAG